MPVLNKIYPHYQQEMNNFDCCNRWEKVTESDLKWVFGKEFINFTSGTSRLPD